MPDLSAPITFGDTPKNGLEEVEDVTQSRESSLPTKDDMLICQTNRKGSIPATFRLNPILGKLRRLGLLIRSFIFF